MAHFDPFIWSECRLFELVFLYFFILNIYDSKKKYTHRIQWYHITAGDPTATHTSDNMYVCVNCCNCSNKCFWQADVFTHQGCDTVNVLSVHCLMRTLVKKRHQVRFIVTSTHNGSLLFKFVPRCLHSVAKALMQHLRSWNLMAVMWLCFPLVLNCMWWNCMCWFVFTWFWKG